MAFTLLFSPAVLSLLSGRGPRCREPISCFGNHRRLLLSRQRNLKIVFPCRLKAARLQSLAITLVANQHQASRRGIKASRDASISKLCVELSLQLTLPNMPDTFRPSTSFPSRAKPNRFSSPTSGPLCVPVSDRKLMVASMEKSWHDRKSLIREALITSLFFSYVHTFVVHLWISWSRAGRNVSRGGSA